MFSKHLITALLASPAISPAATAGYYANGSWSTFHDDGIWEVFADAVEDYGGTGDLGLCIDGVEDWVFWMGWAGYGNYRYATDANAWAHDYEESRWDDYYNDGADFAYFSGHGNSGGFSLHGAGGDDWVGYWEVRWGERDLEVIAIDGCRSLDANGRTNWGDANKNDGVHAIHGFHSDAADVDTTAQMYGYYLYRGYNTRTAWMLATQAGHSSSATGASIWYYNASCNGLYDTASYSTCDPTSGSTDASSTWSL